MTQTVMVYGTVRITAGRCLTVISWEPAPEVREDPCVKATLTVVVTGTAVNGKRTAMLMVSVMPVMNVWRPQVDARVAHVHSSSHLPRSLRLIS